MTAPRLMDWSDVARRIGQADLAELAAQGERASADPHDHGAADFGPDTADRADLRTDWGAVPTAANAKDYLARKKRKADRSGLAVYRLPRGAFLPDDDPETGAGLWRQLSFAEQRTFIGGCVRTNGATWAIQGAAEAWPLACRDAGVRAAAVGRLVGLGIWRRTKTAAGDARVAWTKMGRGLFYLRGRNSPASFQATPYKRPRYVPIHAVLIDSGALEQLRPTALAILPLIQWMGRLSVTNADASGRHGWACAMRRLELLAGIGQESGRRAVAELRALGLVDVMRLPGRRNVYAWTGVLRAGPGSAPVSLGDRWRYAAGVLRAGMVTGDQGAPWPRLWLAVLGRRPPDPDPN